MFLWSVLGFFVCLVLSCEYYTLRTGVPTIASFPSARKKMIEILRQEAAGAASSSPFIILDLGSGSGQLTWRIARAIPEAMVVGVELSFIPWLRSVLRQKLLGPKNLRYVRADFWSFDCSFANVVVAYLTENIIEKVSHKLRKELKQGTVVLANDTNLRGDWTPDAIHDTGFLKLKIFVYRQA